MFSVNDIGVIKVGKEMLGRFIGIFAICILVSFMVSIMYRNSTFDLTQVFIENPKNISDSDSIVDSTFDSSDKLVNNSLDHKFWPEVSSDSKNLTFAASPVTVKDSDSKNDSFQSQPVKDSVSRKDSFKCQPLKDSDSGKDSFQSQHDVRTKDSKFPEGLFTAGLDEGSCLSRYEAAFYRRKPEAHNPSSYLLSKLQEYENLHKRCGPFTRAYNKSIQALKSGRISISSSKCKYIVWFPANGLGNRMVSMAATFLYALLSNRVLLVNHGPDMIDLFCEPFPNSSWLLPESFPLKNTFRNKKSRKMHSFGSNLVNISTKSWPNHLVINLDHSPYDQDKELFYCDKTEALLGNVTWLILFSDQYFAPAFFFSSTYKEEVNKLFPEKDTIFYHLGHYLFSPSNQAWGLITRYYDAYLAKADQRVGLQIRVFDPKMIPVQKVLDQILSCTKTQKILPEINNGETIYSKVKNKTLKAVLVTCLHSEFYDSLKNMYWRSASVTGESVGVYQASHEEYQHFGDNMHNMKAWVEIYLLSLSDVLVTSSVSTFGYVAQGLGGLKPWILDKPLGHDPNHELSCQRGMAMEPCFHFPFNYDCKSKYKLDFDKFPPYLIKCEDKKSGVKLFDHNL